MKQRARIDYLLRHVSNFMPYVTLAKLYNLALNLIELQLKVAQPRSLPFYLKVEPTPLCHMACSGCAHGDAELKRTLTHHAEHLGVEDFKKIIDPIARRVFGVSLSLRGEPLLGKELFSIAEYAHSKKIAVSFPSNLSVKLGAEKLTRLVTSGIDTVYVSLDGTSDATYAQYRVGGDFQLVLRNVKAIAEIKARLGQARPKLVWKFVVFEHNKHEVPSVSREYRRLGFDAFELVEDYASDAGKRTLRNHNANLVRQRKGCFWAWHTTTIRADGKVGPCCHGHHDFGLGNARSTNFRDIWRGAEYARLRRGFRTMQVSDLHPVCARCLHVLP